MNYQEILKNFATGWNLTERTKRKGGVRKKKKAEVKIVRKRLKGKPIRESYINILKRQIEVLTSKLHNYTVKNENTKMMKQELRRLLKNLKKEIELIESGTPMLTEERRPSVRIR